MTPNTTDQPVVKKSLRRTVRRVFYTTLFVLFGVPLLIYAILAARLYTAKPTIGRNYYAELNARNDGFSESQKAYPVYAKARDALADPIGALNNRMRDLEYESDPHAHLVLPSDPYKLSPGQPLYPELVEILQDHSTLIDAIRAASGRPIMGTIYSYTDEEEASLAGEPFPFNPDPTEQPLLVSILLPSLGAASTASKLLIADARHAAETGDTERAFQNLLSALSIARHAEMEPGLIGELVAIAIVRRVNDALTAVLHGWGSAFSAQQLHTLQVQLESTGHRSITLDFQEEQAFQYDIIQRAYTDDGTGDGRIAGNAVHVLAQLNADNWQNPTTSTKTRLLAPLIAPFMATRRELNDYLDEGLAISDGLRSSDESTIISNLALVEDRYSVTGFQKFRFLPVYVLEPAVVNAAFTEMTARAHLRATITRIALERHRLDHNSYPAALADLVPTYLDEIPQDPFDPGQPLKYRLIDDTPHLYYAGADGDDDGGTRPPPDRKNDELKFDLRYTPSDSPSPDAPDADWVITPPQPD